MPPKHINARKLMTTAMAAIAPVERPFLVVGLGLPDPEVGLLIVVVELLVVVVLSRKSESFHRIWSGYA